jgi:hypothetical protein
MSSDRLSQIETSLSRLYKQLAIKQKTLDTIAPEEKERIRQQIADFKQDEIQPLETEHRQILAAVSEQLEISDPDAEVIIGEIVTGVTQIEAQPPDTYSAEMLQLLQEIRDKLNQPGTTAAAKLKGVISSIPPFIGISYEVELDTENVFRKYFPTFTRLLRGAPKK